MRDRVEVLATDGRELHQAHPAIRGAVIGYMGNPTIDGDVVPARGEPRPQLLDAGLEPAIAGRYTARAQHADPDHRQSSREAIKRPQVKEGYKGASTRSRERRC